MTRMSSIFHNLDPAAFRPWELTSFGDKHPKIELEPIPAPVVEVPLIPMLTEEELEAVRQQARQEAYQDAYQSAFEQGLLDGKEQAYAESRTEMQQELQHLQELTANFSAQLQHMGKETGKDLLALALDLAQAMLRTQIEMRPDVILRIAEDAIAQLPSRQQATQIHVHPDDAARVQELLTPALQQIGWRISPDEQITRGGCMIETPQNVIDASLENRWQKLSAHITEQLQIPD